MARPPIIYDLVLVISTETQEEDRAKIVADVEQAVASAGGSVERSQHWGRRPMTFEIDHQAEGDYQLLQFAGPTSLLESLSHTLRIDDRVLRFRIIKVIPGQPEPSDSAPPVLAATPSGGDAGEDDA